MNIKYIIAFAVGMLLLLFASYSGTYYYVTNVKRNIIYTTDQKLLDTKYNVTNTFEPGKSFIYHFHVSYYAVDCYAEYILNAHSDKADYQFPWTRTRQIITDKSPKEFNLNILFQIPDDFPTGKYKLNQLAFPHCHGVDLNPFQTELNQEIEIK